MHRSLQRTPPRIRDGPRREARIPVGVVERLGRKIVVVKRALIGVGEQFCINHARVCIEGHAFAQTVVVHARHHWTFFRNRRLFLDDRSHRYSVRYIFLQADGIGHFAEVMHHDGRNILQALRAGEFVSVRE